MGLVEVKNDILSGQIKPFYIFTGEEHFVRDQYITQLSKAVSDKEIPYITESFSKILPILTSKNLHGGKSCFVIKNDKDFLESEDLQLYMVGHQHLIIFAYDNLDKRSKFYKKFQPHVAEFLPLDKVMIAKYVCRDTGLSSSSATLLSELCGNSYGQVLKEQDKIKQFAMARNLSMEQSFKYLLDGGYLSCNVEKSIVFDLVHEACAANPGEFYAVYEDFKQFYDNPIVFLTVLYNNIRAIMLLQVDKGGQGVCDRTGLTSYQVSLAKEHLGNYTVGELTSFLRKIRDVEKGIKNGTIEQALAIDYVAAFMFM